MALGSGGWGRSAMEFEHKVAALDDEDLVVGEKDEKNWKGIVISLLVIGSIFGAIIVAIILCTPNANVDTNRMKLDFEHVISSAFAVQTFNGSWLSNHEIVYVDQNGGIVVFDAETNRSSSILVKPNDKTLHTMASFKLSPDRQSILYLNDKRREFGFPVSARYAIFNISSQTVEYLDDLIKASTQHMRLEQPRIQYAAWGPQANSLIFIESNDLYYIPNLANAPNYLRLTKTGALSDSITNGLPDSLYRQEIFAARRQAAGSGAGSAGHLYSSSSEASGAPGVWSSLEADEEEPAALWWSPDGRHLAYLSFDDAQVEPTPVEYYESSFISSPAQGGGGQPPQSAAPESGAAPSHHQATAPNQNPRIHYERLPRAGQLNPRVSVHVVDVEGSEGDSPETATMPPPGELVRQQQADPRMGFYVTYVDWLAPNQLLIMWSNRSQNGSILSLCSTISAHGGWRCDILSTFIQRLPPSIDAKRTILGAYSASSATSNATRLIFFALPRPDSIIGDHLHVALLRGDERAPKYLTHGEFDIDRLVHYDAALDTLYFEVKVAEQAARHLYKMSSVGQMARRQTRCLTCHLEEPCDYNYAHLAPGADVKYLVHECLGPEVPVTRMRRLQDDRLTAMNVLVANERLEALVHEKQVPVERFLAIKRGAHLPYDVHIKLYLPNEIDEEKDKRFPLLIQSSEIDRRQVWKRFELDWGRYLASRKQLVYAKIDCIRSTSNGFGSGGGGYQSAASSASSGGYSLVGGGGGGGGGLGGLSFGGGLGGGGSGGAGGGAFGEGSEEGFGSGSSDSTLFNARDQVEVIRFLLENSDLFPFIDKRRVAIWGPSSTSAYLALATTVADDSKLIGCTIAISPITNWRYVNSYAAEHYLGLPWLEANSLRYERANLLKQSHEFALRKLLVVHGTADEQVHVQNSMQFIRALAEHHPSGGVIHQMQLYPDTGHNLARSPIRRHLFMTLDGFVDRCFYQKPITIKATEWKGKVRPKLY